MAGLNRWRRKFAPTEQIRHIFERGDGHDGELIDMDRKVYSSHKLRELTGISSMTIMQKDDPSAEPLQAADFLAYEAAKAMRDYEKVRQKDYEKVRQKDWPRESFWKLLEGGKVTTELADEKEIRIRWENES